MEALLWIGVVVAFVIGTILLARATGPGLGGLIEGRFAPAIRVLFTSVVAGFYLSFAYNYWDSDSSGKKFFAVCLVTFGAVTLARDLRSWWAKRPDR